MKTERFNLQVIEADELYESFGINKYNILKVESRMDRITGEFSEILIYERIPD